MSSGTVFGTLGDVPGPLKTYVFLKEFNDFHYCGNPGFSLVSVPHLAAHRGPRVLREAGFSAPAPLPLDTFTRLFLEYTILLTPSFLAAPHAGPRGRRIREACGHFRRPLENEVATQRILQCGKRNARYLLRCQRPPSQIWSEAKRFMRLLEFKNTSRPLFDWKFQIITFWSKKTLRKCFESSP